MAHRTTSGPDSGSTHRSREWEGRGCRGRDPVLEFYETFLQHYDRAFEGHLQASPDIQIWVRRGRQVEEDVLEKSKTLRADGSQPDPERLKKWLEEVNPEDLGKYRM